MPVPAHFVLAVLAVALTEVDSVLMQNPVLIAIALVVTAGHLSSASCLMSRVRAEINGLRIDRT